MGGSIKYVPSKKKLPTLAIYIKSLQHKQTLVFKVKRNSIHRQSDHFLSKALVRHTKKRLSTIHLYRLLLQLLLFTTHIDPPCELSPHNASVIATYYLDYVYQSNC